MKAPDNVPGTANQAVVRSQRRLGSEGGCMGSGKTDPTRAAFATRLSDGPLKDGALCSKSVYVWITEEN